jgi:acetoin utilization deacetylase AcuC-like enzyme
VYVLTCTWLDAEYLITTIVSHFSTCFRKIPTILTADVGAYSYGLGHPMKPLRMRITHELLTAYDMLGKMDVLVCRFLSFKSLPETLHREQSVQLLRP